MNVRRKILLLGGEGYIGKNLTNYFTLMSDCHSIGLERSLFKPINNNFIKQDPYESKIHGKYDVVIHLIDRKEKIGDLIKLEKKLVENLQNISFKQFIFISSAAVYTKPLSNYAKRKLTLEKMYAHTFGKNIKVAILRLFNTYGPYQLPNRQGSLIATILVNYLLNRKTVIQDIGAKRDFMFSKDIAILIEKVIESNFTGIDDLATNKLTSIQKLVELIENEVIFDSLMYENKNRPEKSLAHAAKSAVAEKTLFAKMEESLQDTLKFYKDNLKIIEKLNG